MLNLANVWATNGYVEEVWREILGIITSLNLVVQSHFFTLNPNQVFKLFCWTEKRIFVASRFIF
jgi:hypothetical protein